MTQFYAYLWFRSDGTPYYVGKGSGNRAFVPHRAGHHLYPPEPRFILIIWCSSAAAALEKERELIASWGRQDIGTGCLRNRTDGGEDPPSRRGKSPSIETRRKISQALRGCMRSLQTRHKISYAMRGNTHGVSYKQSAQGREDTRRTHLGRQRSAATRAKQSAARTAYWQRRRVCQ